MPVKTTAEAILDAQTELLKADDRVFIMGEGVPDPRAIFGTTRGLREQFPERVFDMPVAENGGVGVCIGAAVTGSRPIFITQRADFLLLAADQIINNAAKWHAMFGGQAGSCPLVVRAIIGRGWGQGLQHSQHLENLFERIPGLQVWCPSNAYDAKGMLIAAVRGETPTIIFEHRWIHDLKCEVPDGAYAAPAAPKFVRTGTAMLAAWGYMVHVCARVSDMLREQGITVGVIDLQEPRPAEGSPFVIIQEKDCCPPSPHLSRGFYPTTKGIALLAVRRLPNNLRGQVNFEPFDAYDAAHPHDIPNPDFKGPF